MVNRYEIRDGVTSILIDSRTYGTVPVLIDTADLPRLLDLGFRWCLKAGDVNYAISKRMLPETRPLRQTLFMHRIITGAPKGSVVDHINHDGLDNRRSNLRVVTNSQNMLNRAGAQRNSQSGVRGVDWFAPRSKWRARIMVLGVHRHLGYFSTQNEASAAFEAALVAITEGK